MNPDGKSQGSPGEKRGAERRASERIETRRGVVFSDHRATGPLRDGQAVDRSTGGFRITTHYPEKLGMQIQIELQPNPGDDFQEISFFQGRVVHVQQMDSGEYAMGIRILHRGLAGAPAVSVESTLHSAPPPRDTKVPPGVEASATAVEAPQPADEPHRVTFQRIGSRYSTFRRHWGLWATLVFLILVFALLMLTAVNEEMRSEGEPGLGGTWAAVRPETAPEDLDRSSGAAGGTSIGATSASIPAESVEAPRLDAAALISRAQAALEFGELEQAALLFRESLSDSGAQSVQKFVARIGSAQTAAARGDRSLAVKILDTALQRSGDIPQSWIGVGEELRETIRSSGQGGYAPEPMDTVLNLSNGADTEPVESGLRIEVDTANYLLHVRDGNKTLRSFPVGLGRGGVTPTGEFRIANKVTDPQWYNRGESVPAGSDDNPLGKRWMGLSDDASTTGYGIHPTNEPDSIGRQASAGCIRMRPEDAETLFRLVPVGTPVKIDSQL